MLVIIIARDFSVLVWTKKFLVFNLQKPPLPRELFAFVVPYLLLKGEEKTQTRRINALAAFQQESLFQIKQLDWMREEV